ncbi:MAG: ABC transporter ATP-binding protein [Alkalicoccus sp.]|nr:MAG: ABC transporter ATP-binding protein [Alkalicoccus sp.]
MNEAVQLTHISHTFGRLQVLNDVSITIAPGIIYGLLGPSGSGKTTLIKVLLGILKPTLGQSIVQGTPMPSLEKMKHIGFMAQADALYPELTAQENMEYFASISGLERPLIKTRIKVCLETVDLTSAAKKKVSSFSGGMKRRLSLAAALVHDPDILVLDEPTVGIDPVLREVIWKEFHRLTVEGRTIIVTTHVMDEAEKCDQLALLREGEVIVQGTVEDLKDAIKTDSLEEVFLHYGRAPS